MNIQRLQKSADHHRYIAETVEDPRVAEVHNAVAVELDNLVQTALAHNARLEQLRHR
jgi:hypothetical protein